jgi:hypothetical protein
MTARSPAPAAIRTWPRAFVLIRSLDVSGVSGTGVIAEGVVWWNGSASVCWRGRMPSMTFFPGGIPAIEAIHGHAGSTRVHYLDDLTGPGDPAGAGARS